MEWKTDVIKARGMDFSKEKFQEKIPSYIL